ncbi:MAG: hypothetical protein SGJ18_07565 [Pseudomonadota bacterium]|nr:hypothetical protein [Pseudomonadota bacterium]
MRSEIVFRDTKRTGNLEEFILTQTKGVIEGFFGERNSPHLKVTVYEDRRRNLKRSGHFVCEVILTLRGHHQVIKVTKSDFNFYDCVTQAGIALRKRVRREHKYQISQRRSSAQEFQAAA